MNVLTLLIFCITSVTSLCMDISSGTAKSVINNATQQILEDMERCGVFERLSILDIGCGRGERTTAIAKKAAAGSIVVGFDKSHETIDSARARRDKKFDNLKNLIFGIVDAQSLLCPEEYDCVVSFDALHQIQNQNDLIKSIYDALKRRGLAYFTMSSDASLVLSKFSQMEKSNFWRKELSAKPTDNFYFQTPSTLLGLLEDAGFSSVVIEERENKYEFNTHEELSRWLNLYSKGISALDDLDGVRRKNFLEDVAAEFPQDIGTGKVVLPLSLLIVTAIK